MWYQRSEMDDVRGYKDLWGGLGRLRSDFEPQRLQFFYTRYEKLGVGKLDWLSGTFSVNSQRDGSIRQGLRPTDRIVQDDVDVDAFGYAAQAGAHLAAASGAGVRRRDLRRAGRRPPRTRPIPRPARSSRSARCIRTDRDIGPRGLFVQDVVDIVRGSDRGALKANIGGRFTHVDVETFADRNRNALGQSLGVVDSSQSYPGLDVQCWADLAGNDAR